MYSYYMTTVIEQMVTARARNLVRFIVTSDYYVMKTIQAVYSKHSQAFQNKFDSKQIIFDIKKG